MIKIKGLTSSEIILQKIIDNDCDVEAAIQFMKKVFWFVSISWIVSMILSVVFLFVVQSVWGYVISSIVFMVSTRAIFRIMRHVTQSIDYLALVFLMFFHFARNDETFTFKQFIESLPEYYKYSMKDVGSFYSEYRKGTENE
jgi:hypothetical protein